MPNKNGFGTCLFFSSLFIKREKSILPKGAKNLFENSNPFNEFINLHPKYIDLSLSRLEKLLNKLGNPHKNLPPTIHIAGTNGESNGLVPMLRVFNNTARYVDQGGGKRHGSFAIYLEPWHGDIFEFKLFGAILTNIVVSPSHIFSIAVQTNFSV